MTGVARGSSLRTSTSRRALAFSELLDVDEDGFRVRLFLEGVEQLYLDGGLESFPDSLSFFARSAEE